MDMWVCADVGVVSNVLYTIARWGRGGGGGGGGGGGREGGVGGGGDGRLTRVRAESISQ